MYWEEMREEQFTKAIEDFGGLCVLPLSSLEKHGQHLPVGADGYIADAVLAEATKLEDVVIFPTSCWLGDVSAHPETKADGRPKWRGAIELSTDLQLTLLEEIFDEIRRNGFYKVILLCKQPATANIAGLFMRYMGYEKRDYAMFTMKAVNPKVSNPEAVLKAVTGRRADFHMITDEDIKTLERWVAEGITGVGYCDTALMLAAQEHLVATDRYNAETNVPVCDLSDFDADVITFNGMQNLKCPNIACPAVPEGCTKSIGQALLKLNAEALAAAFKLLKTDEECMRIANGIPMGQK